MKVIFVLVAAAFVAVECGIWHVPQLQRHDEDIDWWQTTVFYQIYPRSFKDSDGDGVGDIQGIISKLDHLSELGITATWLSPIFTSPMKDFGYDIADFFNVDEIFGTMEDLEQLFVEAEKRGIKIILDFVPNHTSDEHDWFQRSIMRDNKYTDYYVWRDGRNDNKDPPNNWVSVFYGSAWTFNEQRGQWYLHQFDAGQPDLNFENEDVVEEMKDVLRFWLGKGAAGFRVDAINHMFEDDSFDDELPSGLTGDPLHHDYLTHSLTMNQDKTYEMIYEWRKLLDQWQVDNGGDTRLMMTEAYASEEHTMRYYQSADGTKQGSHMPFNFVLINDLNEESSAADFKRVIDGRLSAIPSGHLTNWVMGNHDRPRVGSRYGQERIDSMLVLTGFLPGVAVTYYGEEIGMVDNRDISYADTKDPAACNAPEEDYLLYSRDPVRTPMQWDATENAGFTTNETAWLPVHSNYVDINVEAQKATSGSTYQLYQGIVKLRQDHTFQSGEYESKVLGDSVFTYIRDLKDHERYVVLVNFGGASKTVNLQELKSNLPAEGTVVLASSKAELSEKVTISTNSVEVKPFAAFVVDYPSSAGTLGLSLIALMATILRYFL